MGHSFHIPVLGLAFTIDTPLKVAKFGISSVVSIVDDELVERMRAFHAEEEGIPFISISKHEPDSRARRITAYLNLLQQVVDRQIAEAKATGFEEEGSLCHYFEWLSDADPWKIRYLAMLEEEDPEKKVRLQEELMGYVRPGNIDVNIMSKVDKANTILNGGVPEKYYSDALAALRGFAESKLQSSLVLSAGMNPRLYSYLGEFEDFYPDQAGSLRKKVVLKVSDYRSAFIQARFLAKKGIWVSEFRIESGLNCGGHAFATDGYLLGPILEEFKRKRSTLYGTLSQELKRALEAMGRPNPANLSLRITAQGGVGTSEEHHFLMQHYELDGVGWGSPFLLVPEATNVDAYTLQELMDATVEDFYISYSSPLGIPFNNFRKSSAEKARLRRIALGVPGSSCDKKYLVSNTEFTSKPICTASRAYQRLKISQLKQEELSNADLQVEIDKVLIKSCLCSGLSTAAYLINGLPVAEQESGVSICPGPNLVWFKGIYTLQDMLDHIYGRKSLIDDPERPNLFVNELKLYVDYLKSYIEGLPNTADKKQIDYVEQFKVELMNGIQYYKRMRTEIGDSAYAGLLNGMEEQLDDLEERLVSFCIYLE